LLDRNLTVVVELKNGVEVEGTLDYVDDKLNFNLTNIQIKDKVRYPMLLSLKSMFIRGSSLRYI
jgi:U6 snRNA-associated Sm-like protein LSm2